MRPSTAVILFCACSLLASCAKQGYPSGGPRDEKPPQVVDIQPRPGATHFSERSFTIAFDEFVVLNDPDNNIVVSPPLKPKPQYSIRGRRLVVDLPDSLQPNITYLFQMHGAVADFTEGNRIGELEYAFSTGPVIDSLSFEGTVLDAYTCQAPTVPVTVMLYREGDRCSWDDSTVSKVQPDYVARCNGDGSFRFNYLSGGRYRIIAINDADRNLRLNGKEAVAFTDSTITPRFIPHPKDSIDSLSVTSDSTVAPVADEGLAWVMLISADSSEHIQRVVKSGFLRKGVVEVVTTMPMEQPAVGCEEAAIWRLSPSRDTLWLWTQSETCDSLLMVLADSSGLFDTLTLQLRSRRGVPSDAKTQPKTFDVKWQLPAKTGTFDTLWIQAENPLMVAASDAVTLLDLVDSSRSTCPVALDSGALRAYIDTVLNANRKYQLTIRNGALTDLWGHANAETTVDVELMGTEQYGNIFLTCSGLLPTALVVKLTDEKGRVVRSTAWPEGQRKIAFTNLVPGKYQIEAFSDTDGDGKWTPGNYWKHRQPEAVYRLGKTFDVRENWDIEETWQILP